MLSSESLGFKNQMVWSEDGQRNLGNLFLTHSIEQEKYPEANCLLGINTKTDEQTAFASTITMDAEQDKTDKGSQCWQVHKL